MAQLSHNDTRFEVDQRPSGRMTLITFLVLLITGLVVTVKMVIPYFLALAMGGILAFLFRPLENRLKRRGLKPKLTSALVTLAIVFLVIAPISLMVTLAIRQGIAMGKGFASQGTFSFESLFNRLSHWNLVRNFIGSPEELHAQIQDWVKEMAAGISTVILGIVTDIPKIILQLALTSISCFFFLLDGERFLTWMRNKIPLDADVRAKVVRAFRDTANGVILASFATAGVQSGLMVLSFLVLGIPGAFLAMGITFILAWIPILGSGPVTLVGVIYLYSQESFTKMVLMICMGLFIGVVDNFVRPLVLKGRGNMHPLVSLIAVFGGIGMFGITGVFVGPILASILISLLQIWPSVEYRFGLISTPVAENLSENITDKIDL